MRVPFDSIAFTTSLARDAPFGPDWVDDLIVNAVRSLASVRSNVDKGEPMRRPLLASCVLLLSIAATVAATAQSQGAAPRRPAAPAPDPLVPVVWLESAPASGGGSDLPLYTIIPAGDSRVAQAEKLVDNEPARFTRRLVSWAFRTFGVPGDWTRASLPIVLQKGGNYARTGFQLRVNGSIESHSLVPYIILDLDAASLSDTLLHEGGHLLHSIATGGHRPTTDWSAMLHTTFAVTDPLTALAEGYAIHFETLLGHFGRDPEKRGYYHRVAPAFDARNGRRNEFYAPVADLLTFSQSWARYQAVRDTWPAFAGHVYARDYLRSQFDAGRDRAVLKPANAMVASEGVVASILFWTSVALADSAGARFGEGLDQPGLIASERTLLRAIAKLPPKDGFRPDVVDLVGAIGDPGSSERTAAVSRFVSVTRGVTARPGIRADWAALYGDAVVLDMDAATPLFASLDAAREAIVAAALADPAELRRGLGPVLAVSAPKVTLELKVFHSTFPLEFDLNAATEAEWLAAGVDAATSAGLLAERDRAPFSSIGDFERRTHKALSAFGLEEAKRDVPASGA
jgi:hypothetical protein